MNKRIAILPGDGIGPEVMAQAVKVIEAIADKFGHSFNFEEGLIGASAIDKVGDPYPQATHELCMNSDAIMFAAIGDPRYDNNPEAKVRPEQGLMKMRKTLGLYANIRPISTFSQLVNKSPLKEELVDGADFVVFRELTSGIYFGEPRGRSESGATAFDTCIYTKEEIVRIARLAFEFARKRRNKVTAVDKANVLATSRLWRECVTELHSSEFQDVELEFMFVDNAAMQIVSCPKRFDVMLTENLFGDILTDEASVVTGSMGLLPSASIGVHTSLFEPIHGSYPQAAGKNIANPLATILSTALMFEYAFGAAMEAEAIRAACMKTMGDGIVTEDIADKGKGYSTSEVGDEIARIIRC